MRTYPIRDDGKVVALEIDNAYVGVRDVARALNRVEGVSDVSVRRPLSVGEQRLVRFVYRGANCMVVEPFGDNSHGG